MLIAPHGTQHDGPDWIRVEAPKETPGKGTQNVRPRTDARNEAIRELSRNGGTVSSICQMYKIKPNTVRRILLGEEG